MNNPTVSFTTYFEGRWSAAYEVFPIMNGRSELVGGFTVIDGPVWKCFIATRGYIESLNLGNSPVWITPEGEGGEISKLYLTLTKFNDQSKEIHLEIE